MKFDKNTVIGFVLLAVLFFAYFWNANRQAAALQAYEQKQKDSIAKLNIGKVAETDSVKNAITTINNGPSVAINSNQPSVQTEQIKIVENDLFKVEFTNKGGKIRSVTLKKYRSFDSSLVKLGNKTDQIGYNINLTDNKAENTNDLFFSSGEVVTSKEGAQTISYSLTDSLGSPVTHSFTVYPNKYMIDWNIGLQNVPKLLTNNQLNFVWKTTTSQHEKSAAYERQQMSNICFFEGGEFDYISSNTEHQFEKPTNWMSVVQQFFNTTLVAKNNFNNGAVQWQRNAVDTSTELAKIDAQFIMNVSGANTTVPMQLYYGPNDFNVLKSQTPPEMQKIVNLGRDLYAFVRPINKFIIMPIFDLITSFISSYGWAILLLTIFIRLITAPLMYGSYVSGAKMKVLRPELDELKKKMGSDQQGYAMEQMKLFREAGVNPLGGCLPALLQIPIFFALYSFFNTNIDLRGQAFLWSNDLSVFDAVITWKTSIIGISHISMFTITAVITSFLISIYNMGNTPTQDNPALKYMPYIFPFILFFVFNNLPAALTWYYTVSNLITLILQFVIQKFILDHDKILAKIQEKRKNPKVKTKSKWQERYEQMMESQKKIQEMKAKTSGKK
ncbi:MAG: membrane protein insertase YidC [Chitinophagaceae bacterium]|nr:membrane protein insertase YidC [Chitinophagaceae bacterium]